MHVGVCRLTLHIYASQSLKEKRRVVRSVSERLRQKFSASVAEVDSQDKWQLAVLGVSVVSGEAQRTHELVDAIIRFVAEFSPEAELTASDSEVFSYED
jgi:uncharacterized protein YlxP (DUF503 family)